MTSPFCTWALRSLTTFAYAGSLYFSTAVLSVAVAASTPDLLYQSDSVLEVRIVAPFTTISSARQSDEELPGTLQYTNSAGESYQFDINIRSRGRFRRDRDICRFPPLRLNFKKSQTKNTLFHKQDKVKLVTHCQRRARYEHIVLQEYIAYRMLNLLTDVSFRVRLLRITYVNSDRKNSELTRYGLLIEHRDRLAHRLDKSSIGIAQTSIAQLDAEHTNTVSLFHFMIGNTDFSPIKAAPGRSCCHNHTLIGKDDGPYWSVPYDFDQSGLVDAPYAVTNPKFKLRNARDRLYRGRCANNEHLAATIALFMTNRNDIEGVVSSVVALPKNRKKAMLSFVAKFYKLLESEQQINNKLTGKCR